MIGFDLLRSSKGVDMKLNVLEMMLTTIPGYKRGLIFFPVRDIIHLGQVGEVRCVYVGAFSFKGSRCVPIIK